MCENLGYEVAGGLSDGTDPQALEAASADDVDPYEFILLMMEALGAYCKYVCLSAVVKACMANGMVEEFNLGTPGDIEALLDGWIHSGGVACDGQGLLKLAWRE